ncbi:hypothetical protein [Flavobacterium sp.]|uniref:hypothetical protein n=1 Tax=Flavobacterium sp. TaxID=239 RepID=UPI0026093AAD|nr:hypothetical protein [Flavobacterium sp.]MDD3005911.1 hypothetical protein [Flavobacterium sp.]
MRFYLIFLLLFSSFFSVAQDSKLDVFKKDSLLIIKKDANKGFQNDYILFIPKGTSINKKIVLLVEPNNTGKTSDSIEIHKESAINLATVSSVGNNVATMLKIPLLVPIFPRPSSQELIYTHALDRDVILDNSQELKRLDLQLLEMIKDAKNILSSLNIKVDDKIFMNGFSASATFTNRFAFIHPEKIKALAIGGFNGELMLPEKKINQLKFNYPLGIHDFSKLFNKNFDINQFKSIPQFIYMGKLDENDAVQFEDAYNDIERNLINSNLGIDVQNRYLKCQEIYKNNNVNATFITYDNVGHWTTSEMNLEVIKFFFNQMHTN